MCDNTQNIQKAGLSIIDMDNCFNVNVTSPRSKVLFDAILHNLIYGSEFNTISIFKWLALIQAENWLKQSFPGQGHSTKVNCRECFKKYAMLHNSVE